MRSKQCKQYELIGRIAQIYILSTFRLDDIGQKYEAVGQVAGLPQLSFESWVPPMIWAALWAQFSHTYQVKILGLPAEIH